MDRKKKFLSRFQVEISTMFLFGVAHDFEEHETVFFIGFVAILIDCAE